MYRFFSEDQCFLKHSLFSFLSSMLNKCLLICHPENYPMGKLLLRSLARLLPNRSSFHLIYLWRLLLEASLFSPTSHLWCWSSESQERSEGRHCSPAPHTSSPFLGWSQHTPSLHARAPGHRLSGQYFSTPSPTKQREEETTTI